jgi:hypothetical protein
MERGDDRNLGPACSSQGCDAAHPVVGVGYVRRMVSPREGELVAEVTHEGCEVFLGQLTGWSGGHVDDVRAWAERHPFGLACCGAPRVDGYLMPGGGKGGGEFPHVYVLPAGIGAADILSERAGVLRDQGYRQ